MEAVYDFILNVLGGRVRCENGLWTAGNLEGKKLRRNGWGWTCQWTGAVEGLGVGVAPREEEHYFLRSD